MPQSRIVSLASHSEHLLFLIGIPICIYTNLGTLNQAFGKTLRQSGLLQSLSVPKLVRVLSFEPQRGQGTGFIVYPHKELYTKIYNLGE